MNANHLEKQLKRHEGFRAGIYLCTAGKRTIGYGRNLDDKPFTDYERSKYGIEGDQITEDQASKILLDEIYSLYYHYREFGWFMEMVDARQNVILNMAYNLGIKGVNKFRKTLIYIKRHDYEQASIEMLDSKWADQVGQRAIELSNQMRTGEVA